MVVTGRSIEVHNIASEAPVDEHPFTVTSHGDGDGFHRRSAVGVAIAGHLVVEVLAPQAARTVVAMRGPGCVEWDVETAMTAAERAATVVLRA